MLRHSADHLPIWPTLMQETSRCLEHQLQQIVLRLRILHWNMEEGVMKNILSRYTIPSSATATATAAADVHYGLIDTPALPYTQLRFDSPTCPPLPKVEMELPDFAASKNLSEKTQSSLFIKRS